MYRQIPRVVYLFLMGFVFLIIVLFLNLYLSRTKASAKRSPRRRPSGQKRLNREPICEKDPSPLPHWKLYGTICRQPSHTMRAAFTSERKTNVRSTSSETNLAQSVSHSFWVNVAIMIAYRSYSGFSGSNVAIAQVGKKNSPVLTWCHYARTSPSRAVCNPSSISQTTDKTLYGRNIHTKL